MTSLVFVLASGQNAFFPEIAKALQFELGNLGVQASLSEDGFPDPETGAVPVLLAPQEYARLAPLRPRDLGGAICICAEQPESTWFASNLRFARAAGAVLDLNGRGAAAFRRLGVPAVHLQLGYTSFWDRLEVADRRSVDVAFLAGVTPRRERLLASYAERLSRWKAEVVLADNRQPNTDSSSGFLIGEDKLRLLARSRVLLNLHRSEEPHFEWLRALDAIHCGAVLVSEWSSDHDPLVAGEHFVSARPEALQLVLEAVLEDEARRSAIASQAYTFLRSQMPMSRAAEALADAAAGLSRLGRRRRSRPPAVGKASSRPRPTLGRRLIPLMEAAMLPLTRLGEQMKEIRFDLDRVSRRLEELSHAVTEGSPPPPVETVVDSRMERDGDRPKVSVAITVYDYAHVVAGALDSVVRSGFRDLEIVVVDDASRDGSAGVVERWISGADAPAALFRHPVNRGVPHTRNTAVAQARGDYVLMLDADNELLPHGIQRLVGALDADPEAGFAYGILQRFDETGPLGLMNKFGWDTERLRRGNYIDALALIRREVLDRIGGYNTDQRLFGWDDYDLWCSVASLGLRGAYVREIVARYRVAPGSMTSLTDLSTETARHAIAARHPAVFRGQKPRSSTAERIAEWLS